MKKTLLIGLISILSISSLFAQTINSSKSEVTFKISNMAFNSVNGSFTGMKDSVQFDPSNLQASSFNVCIDASTVDTDNEKRDDHLRNEDFFYVEKFPNICFTSSTVEKAEEGYIAKGSLNLHGVTKEVEVPFTYQNNTFKGELTLNRFDYQLGEGTNTFMVGEEVEIVIICVVE